MKKKLTMLGVALVLTACSEGEIPESFNVTIDAEAISELIQATPVQPVNQQIKDPEITVYYAVAQEWRFLSGVPFPIMVYSGTVQTPSLEDYQIVLNGEVVADVALT
jgi:hypothetical protein